jgi:hypothetical protein
MESADSSFKVVSLTNGSVGWTLKLDCLSQQLQRCTGVETYRNAIRYGTAL